MYEMKNIRRYKNGKAWTGSHAFSFYRDPAHSFVRETSREDFAVIRTIVVIGHKTSWKNYDGKI